MVWSGIGPDGGVTPRLNPDGIHPLVEGAIASPSALTSLAVTTGDCLDVIDPGIRRLDPTFGGGPSSGSSEVLPSTQIRRRPSECS